MRCQVAIIGAGPAGLALGQMLHLQGIDSVIIERRSRDHVAARVRAGVLEQVTVDVLHAIGVGARLAREALVHHGFYLRFDNHTHHLDFHADSGRHAYVYGQSEIVADLIDARIASGQPLVFEADDVAVTGVDSARPQVSYVADGRHHTVDADFVAGCDGQHGICRSTLPAGTTTEYSRTYPAAWLGILAHSKPVAEEGMYSVHPDGLALHSMRGPRISRQYLQVPAGTEVRDWPDDRIWKELLRRSTSDDSGELETGDIVDKSVSALRSIVVSPMQYGSLFLVGDSAHIVPPTGAKGLNMAVSDACVLSHALGAHYGGHTRAHLDAYSDTALARTWQVQSFAATLTEVLHRFSDDPFEWELRRARLQRWVSSPTERQALGEVYLGLPFPTPWAY
ncbi:4-hydroxybenzoate 3-monooxygenase [Mycolicibacterium sp. S2-37]|uniref:4-hydroxybenzoate 3-monooxygenase n=1 Tax=Mycolicibacterium sp. S2-37 TaxID=2810297 RepID=UPI001A94FB66|nr:4-hydroxybenzoate 3-monooxygenase [Mycolicibacterium sp. S2-37]MBO0676486.1 4-hydroxybenzoate 3-monooxygenase [Mycolicibacterium sp. S2-37]